MRDLKLPPAAVLVLIAQALPEAPHFDIAVDEEWWAGADKLHRKALFVGSVEALGRLGNRVIPEEFTHDRSGRPLDPFDHNLDLINRLRIAWSILLNHA